MCYDRISLNGCCFDSADSGDLAWCIIWRLAVELRIAKYTVFVGLTQFYQQNLYHFAIGIQLGRTYRLANSTDMELIDHLGCREKLPIDFCDEKPVLHNLGSLDHTRVARLACVDFALSGHPSLKLFTTALF